MKKSLILALTLMTTVQILPGAAAGKVGQVVLAGVSAFGTGLIAGKVHAEMHKNIVNAYGTRPMAMIYVESTFQTMSPVCHHQVSFSQKEVIIYNILHASIVGTSMLATLAAHAGKSALSSKATAATCVIMAASAAGNIAYSSQLKNPNHFTDAQKAEDKK